MAFSYPESEADFVNKVSFDLKEFVESSSVNSVLVFPPVNSFYRFLIHQLAQDSFEQLRTFSIGEDPDRRIVVCTKELVARIDAGKDEQQPCLKTPSSSQLTMVVSDAERSINSQVRKSRSSLPTVGIYRPPAARRLTGDCPKPLSPSADSVIEETSAKHGVKPTRPRVRRPDQQVYVPRAKRAFQEPEKFEDAASPPVENQAASRVTSHQQSDHIINEKSRSNLIIEDRKSSKHRSSSPTSAPPSLPPWASQLVEIKKKLCHSTSSELDVDGIDSAIPVEGGRIASTMNTLPPRIEDLVEKKKKLCQANSLNDDYKWTTSEEEVPNLSDQKPSVDEKTFEPSSAFLEADVRLAQSDAENSSSSRETENASVIDIEVTSTRSVIELDEDCDKKYSDTLIQDEGLKDFSAASNSIPVHKHGASSTAKCNIECESSDEDIQDSNHQKENGLTNMSGRSSGGSSESLSSSDSVSSPVNSVQLIKPVKVDPAKKTTSSKPTRIFNPDECDWDALLDEDGEVLDPFLMKELSSAVGEVQVTQPRSDYRIYRSQVPADQPKTRRSIADDDFSHVVEIFSFPPEFKTNDLVAVFSPFKNSAGGFEIKWVDDTHALGVFASTLIAEQVLAYQHPMVRTRPLCDATLESRLKARRLSESIQSFRPRPETCAALARRLVTGALGVKLATARQEREEEKRVLKEAREKRKLAAQQREDIWNSG